MSKSAAEEARELMGTLTMCWKPMPSGVFDSSEAIRIGDEIERLIRADERARILEKAGKDIEKAD